MATKYYGINDKWTDDDIENVIEIASEDGTVDSVKVNGEEYGGGGGGSDIHTLTLINNTTGAQSLMTDSGYGDVSAQWDYPAGTIHDTVKSQSELIVNSNNTGTMQIVASSDYPAVISFTPAEPPLTYTPSGDITQLPENEYSVMFAATGNGAITITE